MDQLQPEQFAQGYLGHDRVEATLGSGIDGIVFSTSRSTAIKLHEKRR